MDLSITSLDQWYETHREQILDDFFEFLKFQSIGTDSSYDQQTLGCAQWLIDYLEDIGLETSLIETPGKPIVWATDLRAGEGCPTLLLYHHYDVQPVDPLELWESPPFEPTIRDGQVYARGAQDNKGQCFYTLTALKALYQTYKTLPFNIKLFIEGEEEDGSVGTKAVFDEHLDKWKADALLAIDADMGGTGKGAITLGMRGILTAEVTIRSANGDMHSGGMGGIAYNPIRALSQILSSCFDDEGRIAIDHFYDDVDPITDEIRSSLDLQLDEEKMKEEFGLRRLAPEPGYTIGESVSLRPTFEINGIIGGYTGEGFKTVLPAEAKAKISCRLVTHQDPQRIAEHLEAHLRRQLPKGLELIFDLDQGAPALRSSGDSSIANRVANAYEEVLGVPCKKIVSGGSIPVVSDLAAASGGDVLVMGFGLGTDQIHAPNEHFGLDRLKQGFLTIGRIFASFE